MMFAVSRLHVWERAALHCDAAAAVHASGSAFVLSFVGCMCGACDALETVS